jgi:hypothetical protein
VEQSGKTGAYQMTLGIIKKTWKRGEMTFRRDGEVLLVSWMDKKIITMISTMHSAEMVEIPTKFGKKENEARMHRRL